MGQKLQLFFFISSHNSWSLEKERRSLEEPRGHASLAASTTVTPLSSASSTPLMGGSQRVSGSQVGCPKEPLIATSSDQTEFYPNILPHRFYPNILLNKSQLLDFQNVTLFPVNGHSPFLFIDFTPSAQAHYSEVVRSLDPSFLAFAYGASVPTTTQTACRDVGLNNLIASGFLPPLCVGSIGKVSNFRPLQTAAMLFKGDNSLPWKLQSRMLWWSNTARLESKLCGATWREFRASYLQVSVSRDAQPREVATVRLGTVAYLPECCHDFAHTVLSWISHVLLTATPRAMHIIWLAMVQLRR